MSSKSGPERAGRRRPWPLAARLTAWYAAWSFALVLVATGFLYWALTASLDGEDDEELADKVRVLRAALRDRPGDLSAVRSQAEWGWAARQHAPLHVRLLDAGGRAVLETPGMERVLPAALFPEPLPDAADPGGHGADVRAAGGRPFRVLAARAGGPGAGYVIQTALDRSPEEELLARYRSSLWAVLGLALVASAVGGYRIARRGLRPVAEITRTARRVRAATLGERLDAAGLPAELAALADTFNAMLDRLEESFARLGRFSADIAHELRTPVNNLRGEAEVALARPRSPEEYRDVLGSCLEECGRLARLIDSLLFLARAEDPRTQVEREPLDLARELAAVREFYEPQAAETGVTLTLAAPEAVVAEVNRPLLQRAVGNLVANAVAHTPPGGRVTLSAAREAGRVRVEVTDTGCGIPEAHQPRLFERFFRVDRARSSASGGVGLGLAIVKGIAELHGGSVSLTSAPGRGTRVTLLLPAPADGAPSPG
jgi:two-component system heavy metal sensor histidine kinase CusS